MKSAATVALFLFGLIFDLMAQPPDAGKRGYTVKGCLRNAGNASVVLENETYYKKIHPSYTVKADSSGNFIFRGIVKEPDYYHIRLEGRYGETSFILENSEIEVSGNADSISSLSISGSLEQDIRNQFDRIVLDPTMQDQIARLHNEWKLAKDRRDTAQYDSLSGEVEKWNAINGGRLKTFFSKYPHSQAGISCAHYLLLQGDVRGADSIVRKVEEAGFSAYDQVQYFRSRIDRLKSAQPGKKLPLFEMPDTAGHTVNLTKFKGKYLLLDFWASWCSPCLDMNQELLALYARFRNRKFEIVAISLDDQQEPWIRSIRQQKLPWQQLCDLKGWNNELAQNFGFTKLPQSYLIDPEGTILAVDMDEFLLGRELNFILPAR